MREMKKGFDNKTLDQISRRLFATEPLPPSEIDQIVAKPELFSRVREQIAIQKAASVGEFRRASPVRRYVIAYSGMALTVAAAGAVYFNKPESAINVPNQVLSSKVPDAVPDVARAEVPPQPITSKLSAVRATKDEIRVEKAISTRIDSVKKPRVDAEPDTHFLAVSYTGDPDETSAGGQVIRVEMKRSSLFALGVDIPLENDDAIIRADLLIGRDGVTRAIRVVD